MLASVSSDSAPEELALDADDLVVVLGGTRILDGVTLRVSPGRIVGVLGPSGAGKTTLFRALVGELVPSRGSVRVGGRDVTAEPLWRRARAGVGYVPQGPSILLDLSVRDNIRTFTRLVGKKPGGESEQAALVGLSHRMSVRGRDLSGGEQRRLSLLRALAARPTLLVCDEPFAGIDPARATEIGALLRTHADGGAGVVIADHRVKEALAVCDEAHLLAEGRIETSMEPSRFADDPAVRARYLG
jgi:lipopolysaccharide export system ATP-binding protein